MIVLEHTQGRSSSLTSLFNRNILFLNPLVHTYITSTIVTQLHPFCMHLPWTTKPPVIFKRLGWLPYHVSLSNTKPLNLEPLILIGCLSVTLTYEGYRIICIYCYFCKYRHMTGHAVIICAPASKKEQIIVHLFLCVMV